jgi:hypothetical protein
MRAFAVLVTQGQGGPLDPREHVVSEAGTTGRRQVIGGLIGGNVDPKNLPRDDLTHPRLEGVLRTKPLRTSGTLQFIGILELVWDCVRGAA